MTQIATPYCPLCAGPAGRVVWRFRRNGDVTTRFTCSRRACHGLQAVAVQTARDRAFASRAAAVGSLRDRLDWAASGPGIVHLSLPVG